MFRGVDTRGYVAVLLLLKYVLVVLLLGDLEGLGFTKAATLGVPDGRSLRNWEF
jgi:hypothetical protein